MNYSRFIKEHKKIEAEKKDELKALKIRLEKMKEDKERLLRRESEDAGADK
ncbi:hypothetical protein PROFUN_14995 [Planoprotostelium fungivorum]|uniref:Uncharacterized protein n=1 Tax=Planoprotostelium fungivorum TaxID=1890364 RepID=A0A2P6MY55_9EUKA|nr:hypothetical protein PROFUN_14995 [Planoprotostelium fungivorum]